VYLDICPSVPFAAARALAVRAASIEPPAEASRSALATPELFYAFFAPYARSVTFAPRGLAGSVVRWKVRATVGAGALALSVVTLAACDRSPRRGHASLTSASIDPTSSTRGTCNPGDRPLPNAGLRAPAGLGGCPPGMAPIEGRPGRCIDRWEAFLVELAADGSERSVSPYVNPDGRLLRAESAPQAVPQAYIDAAQAARACELAEKRLCTDDEWLAACRGSAGRAFPYGATERLGTCNDHRTSNAALDDGPVSSTETQAERLQSPCVDQEPNTLMRAGSKPGCATPEGVYDLVGNLHEWTSSNAGATAFRGGFFGDTEKNGQGCDYVTRTHDASYWDYSTGFRCCADRP
jgi:hypothetical protein